MEEVAQAANQNPTALCRSFKRVAGCTILQFLNRLRIEKACQLLQSTDMTVSQIAFQVGFNTFAHFSTQFKSRLGLSPTDFRNKLN